VETRFDHVGLSVADLDGAVAFYSAAFGFASQGFAFQLPGGIGGMMLDHPSGIRLELFQHPNAAPGIQGAVPLEAIATRGYGHFALTAADIGPVYEGAVAAGARGVMDPAPSPEPGVRFAFLADPEGNLVELVERG
jgi:catechol 2,3-dioxygenase-like lactoylglutathione lyase family enzyme